VADLLTPLAIFATFSLILAGLWWLASSLRRRHGSAVMGPFEEIWHPAAHSARIEVRQQVELPAPELTPRER
jgi:hypothetical protein